MGNQSASRLHGDDYQHLHSWLKILDLLSSDTEIAYVIVEDSKALSVDDITVHPKKPEVHPTQYYQVKGHRDLSRTYSMEGLASPLRSGSKSLLEKLWESWQQLRTGQQGAIEIWLISDWNADELLGKHIRNEQFSDLFFRDFLNAGSDVGKACAMWQSHLKIGESDDFSGFCRSIRFDLGFPAHHLWKLAKAIMGRYGMKTDESSVWTGIGIVRDWIKEGRRKKITQPLLLRRIEQAKLWAEPSQLTYPVHIIERRFTEATDKALKNIRSTIRYVGHIPRQEIHDVESQLKQKRAVILIGDAGTGKSGIVANLAKSARAEEKVALFLDARALSHIQDESELQRYLNLDPTVRTALSKAAHHKECRLIIDQLDNVLGSRTSQMLVDLVLACHSQPGLEAVVVSRRDVGADEIRRLIEQGFVEQTSHLLDTTMARKALGKLGIDNPSAELIQLARTLLYLEIIGFIKEENIASINFSSLTNEVTLWEKYLRTISRKESIGRGSDHATKVIAEAKRLARKSLKNEEAEICLDEPVTTVQRRLIGTVLTRLSGRIYRFQHEELQYFLYAKAATEIGEMPATIVREIGHLARNVLPWMKKLYSQQADESDHASHLYAQFMRETLNVS